MAITGPDARGNRMFTNRGDGVSVASAYSLYEVHKPVSDIRRGVGNPWDPLDRGDPDFYQNQEWPIAQYTPQ